jgi:cytochrome c heme-lyase
MGNTQSSLQKEEGNQECPIPEQYRSKGNKIYNVYNQLISDGNESPANKAGDILDPRNNMPLEANQQPCPGQKDLLSTEREQSTIPKGGTSSTWLYPSPQMFYNGT